MGYNTEHRGRIPNVFVPNTGQFLNSPCIRTNQSSEGILDIVLSSQKTFGDNIAIQEPFGSSDHNLLHSNINILCLSMC